MKWVYLQYGVRKVTRTTC